MSASLVETIGTLKDLLNDLREASCDSSNGHFLGGDPNTFTPDPEASSPGDRARHTADCEKWHAGVRHVRDNDTDTKGLTPTRGRIDTLRYKGKDVEASFVPHGYGFGVTSGQDDRLAGFCEDLQRAIDELEGFVLSHEGLDPDDD